MRSVVCLIAMILIISAWINGFCAESGSIVRVSDNRYQVKASERIVNITPEEAERRAVNKAREKAVEFHSGVEVSSRLVNFEAEIDQSEIRQYFSNITTIMSQGFIVSQKLIEKTTEVVDNVPEVRITLELEVGVQKGKRDHSFNINAALNQHTFREGERLVLTVVPSQNCYINVINIYSNETTALIFPNVARNDNYASARKPYQIPAESDIFSFPLYLLSGKEKDTESLLIVATKQRYDFPSFSNLSRYNTYESNLTEIMKELSKIPRDEIEITFLEYGVFRR